VIFFSTGTADVQGLRRPG